MPSDGKRPFQPEPLIVKEQPGEGSTQDEPRKLGGTVEATPAAVEAARLRTERNLPEVPGYRLRSKLGAGTYGEVWLAEEQKTGIRLAIKFFAHGVGEQWKLLQGEVKQLGLLHADPGIVQLEDCNPDAARPYYVMRYAEGGSLARRLEQGPLPLPEALRIFRQVAEALAYVHAKGIRHCDLKPGNVLLDARGRPLIADFGQAHLAHDASPALGTFFYMAPEQADLDNVIPDTRWDVYGLGALFYAMLSGGPPREDSTLRDQIGNTTELSHRLRRYRELIGQARRPDGHRRVPGMDRPMAEILDRCLEVDPRKRWRDAGAVLDALDRYERQRRQRPLLAFVLAAPVLVLLVIGFFLFWTIHTVSERAKPVTHERYLQRNQLRAQRLAESVGRQLADLRNRVASAAEEEELRRAVASPDKERLKHHLETVFLKNQQDQTPFNGWVIIGRDGHDLAGWSAAGASPDKNNWSGYRDYFHGKGHGRQEDRTLLPPIDNPYICDPYRARTTANGPEDGPTQIAISAPVRTPGGGQVVGVLVAGIELERLQSIPQHDLQTMVTNDGMIVLVNRQGYCLLHGPNDDRILNQQLQERRKQDFKRAWYKETVDKTQYQDPLDGGVYVAGFAPIADGINWTVVVQNNLKVVDKALDEWTVEIDKGLLPVGIAGLITISLLIPALWAWLLWVLRREERKAYGGLGGS